MDKKLEFNEALSALVEYATVNGNSVSTENVHTYFKDILDSEDMYIAIYKYLAENNVKITDYDTASLKSEKPDAPSDNCDEHQPHHHHSFEEENMFIKMYMDELSKLPEPSPGEKALLIEKGCRGDRTAFTNLVEAYLPKVIEIADVYMDKGVRRGDLIQEGNLGLIEAIMNYDNVTDFDIFIEKYIKNAMQDAIDEETSSRRIANHAAERANTISEATETLAKELGREATVEELCEYMSLSEEEIRDVMKMSLDAMTINDK